MVGEFQNSDSPYGTFDQGGNVWEWNEEILYQDATYADRAVRGGSFATFVIGLHASFHDHEYPTFQDRYTGFRVVQVPEAATAALFMLGGLLVARSRHTLR